MGSETYAQNTNVINLLPSVYRQEDKYGNPFESSNGIIWTRNTDGSVTAKGTATANSTYYFCSDSLTPEIPALKIDPTKRYTIHGCPANGSTSTYAIRIRVTPDGTTPSGSTGSIATDSGNGRTLNAGYSYLCVYAVIYNGYECPSEGITFYPMVEVGTTRHNYVSSQSGSGSLVTRMKSAESSITQNATNIESKVSYTDYTGNEIATRINQTSTTIKLEGTYIDLRGTVTANDYFKINTDGSMAATGGKIGGWEIDSQYIQKYSTKDTTELQYWAGLKAPATVSSSDYAFSVQTSPANSTSWSVPFGVKYDGSFVATNANITGKITATSGTIGGWNINSSGLSYSKAYGDTTYSLTLRPYSTDAAYGAIYVTKTVGSTTTYPVRINYDGSFVATNATITGTVTATGGSIAGWSLSSTQISKSVTSSGITYTPFLYAPASPGLTNAAFGISKIENGTTTYPWYVRYNGTMVATSAEIAGKVTATSGKIANFTVNGSMLECSTEASGTQYQVYMNGVSASSSISGSGAFGIRKRTYSGTTAGAWSYNFLVYSNGKLYCTDVDITGKITATSGSFTGSITSSSATITGGSINISSTSNDDNYQTQYISMNTKSYKNWIAPNQIWFGSYSSSGAQQAGTSYMAHGVYGDSYYNNSTNTGIYLHIITAEGGEDAGKSRVLVDYVRYKINSAQTSDRRYKTNIYDLDENEAVETINRLTPVTYEYIYDMGKRRHGFVAQDLLNQITDNKWSIVSQDEEGMYSVSYNEFIADLVANVKMLNRKVATLEALVKKEA